MARTSLIFCENGLVSQLLQRFPISQGSLFHYTSQLASCGIRNGEFWLTRADSFLDTAEIAYGKSVLATAASVELGSSLSASFNCLLAALDSRLKDCYVLSASEVSDSEHLLAEYSGESGVVLELPDGFAREIHLGMQQIPSGNESFRCFYIVDRYELFEGAVIYEEEEQRKIAGLACTAFEAMFSEDAHVVDRHHFVDVLMKCLILFKRPKFSSEQEYRLALLSKPGDERVFRKIREQGGRQVHFTWVQFNSREITEAGTK